LDDGEVSAMAVRPTGSDADWVDVWHDEGGHGGRVARTDIAYEVNRDGTVNTSLMVIACPVAGCDAHSVHPVSGGVAPLPVRALFAEQALRQAKKLGLDLPDLDAARALVRQQAIALDGPRAGEDGTP
jgi:hypothetical protein